MEVKLKEITVRELVKAYQDNDENGVVGYNGRLDIRPPFQREFVYNDKQQKAVIDTLTKGFPLNVMYWAVRDNDKEKPYEMIDGQQRTLSICKYVNSEFSFKELYFHNLEEDQKEQILNYELTVYICDGTDSDKLEWFKTINIAGEELTNQELRNAVYHGPWVTDAKRYFSKTGCPAYQIGSDYLRGTPIRQDYLETVLKWISDIEQISIKEYMAKHQQDKDAAELWVYFDEVISWVKRVFPEYRKEMKGLDWGIFYNKFRNNSYNPNDLEKKTKELMIDDDVTKKSGIYEYLLSGEEKHLNIRSFTQQMKREAYEKQAGICYVCNEHFEINEMEGDHITPWSEGGSTLADNCQMLCISCNRTKSNK